MDPEKENLIKQTKEILKKTEKLLDEVAQHLNWHGQFDILVSNKKNGLKKLALIRKKNPKQKNAESEVFVEVEIPANLTNDQIKEESEYLVFRVIRNIIAPDEMIRFSFKDPRIRIPRV